MATADKLNKLLETKNAIRQAIIDKGVEVPDETVFADYPNKIAEIEGSNDSGSGSDSYEEELSGSYVIVRFENCEEGNDFIKKAKELDLSHFDTSNISNMSYMFDFYWELETLDISNFDTSNVYNMENMFGSCENLRTLDISHFNTSNVESMSGMFAGCNNLETLDLSNFNTSNVRNMENMFEWCGSLETLDISWFDTSNVENMSGMFNECNNLRTLKLDNCSFDTIDRIINDTNLPTGLVFDEDEYEDRERKMYVNPNNVEGLTPPEGWVFYNCETGEEIVPDEDGE